jgi:hypothetical protein
MLHPMHSWGNIVDVQDVRNAVSQIATKQTGEAEEMAPEATK